MSDSIRGHWRHTSKASIQMNVSAVTAAATPAPAASAASSSAVVDQAADGGEQPGRDRECRRDQQVDEGHALHAVQERFQLLRKPPHGHRSIASVRRDDGYRWPYPSYQRIRNGLTPVGYA